jgi:hypothetical protein
MSEQEIKFVERRSGIAGEHRDILLRELESKIIALTASVSGALPKKTVDEIEKIIDEYHRRWKA